MAPETKKRKWSYLLTAGAAVLLVAVAAGIIVFFQILKIAKNLPDPQKTASWQVAQSTKIYDRTGKILLYEISGEGKRTVIPIEDVPEYVKQATVAIEDQSFYQHSGLDWRGILRAVWANLKEGGLVQGGSTITQQLAKNAFLTNEKTFTRKIKELILSYWIEKYYPKEKILELYLNQIPYGANTYGIEAASQTFLGKSTKDLTLAEAATLASIPKSPTYYSPWGTHVEELLQRKNYVLERMLKLGYIDQEEFERNKKISLQFNPKNIGSIKAPHFVMMIKDYLAGKYGEATLEKGGLKVITSLDWNLQQIAEKVVKEGAERNSRLYNGKNAALVAQDNKTGQILALVGSADYFDVKNEGNFNVAAQGLRQPGSSFKPFAYLTAFKTEAVGPQTVVFDLPTEFSTDASCPAANIVYGTGDSYPCYHPQNFDHIFRGPVDLRTALAQSINVPAVKTLYLAGLNQTIQTAQALGITTLNDPDRFGLSLVLGGGEVRLTELTGAYATFAQDGTRHEQAAILSVEDMNGNVMEKYLDKASQAVEPQYARLINDILSDNEARRGLFQGSFDLTVFPDRQVALKTGTTNDYVDAWTLGYTPSLSVGVWAGNNRREPMQRSAGSILAALPIWSAFMNEALKSYPIETFSRPEPVNLTKPMANGQYFINNEAHNILFYLDRENLSGDPPGAASRDPQFRNWEIPVQNWFAQNKNVLSTQPLNSSSPPQ